MTQAPRTTESESRDNAAIRDLMHQIQDRLTVPDRATLALGLIGHLATLMNGRQIEKLLGQLAEQASKVQDVPPSRRQGRPDDDTGHETREASATAAARAADAMQDAARNQGGERRLEGRTHPREVGVQGRGALTDDAGPIL